MWESRTTRIEGGTHHRLVDDGESLSFRTAFELLAARDSFIAWYSALLAGSGSDAFFWELPPLSTATIDGAAEFVLLDAPQLAGVTAQPGPFSEQFEGRPETDVLVFPNLGGDALLVVPGARGPLEAYPHLAAFVRNAPGVQIRSLWKQTATTLLSRLADERTWLSTSGVGVHWLHVRFDSSPKYIQHEDYRG
jgi:hypothetical protein